MSQNALAGDARYSTRNTNLAACIGSLKIPVKTEQPVTKTRDDESGNTITTFWFERHGAEEFCGKFHDALELERFWNHRAELEQELPTHPLIPMRQALDRRDWLTKAWHGHIMPASSLDRAGFATEDLFLAAVLMACGHRLLRLDKPRYVFGKIPKLELANIISDFNNFEMIGVIERPVALMRRALECRKLLVALTRHSGLETQLRFTDGICDADGGKMAFISDKASDQQINKTLDALFQV